MDRLTYTHPRVRMHTFTHTNTQSRVETPTQRERTRARTGTRPHTSGRMHPRTQQRLCYLSLALDRAALKWRVPVLAE